MYPSRPGPPEGDIIMRSVGRAHCCCLSALRPNALLLLLEAAIAAAIEEEEPAVVSAGVNAALMPARAVCHALRRNMPLR